MKPLDIRHITVRNGKLDFELAVPLSYLRVSEEAAARVLGLLPNLQKHICVNEKGSCFGDEIVGTELAHLFEHVLIELQGQAYAGHCRVRLIGHTSWLDELAQTAPKGFALMRTTVSFKNDLVALRAANDAQAIVSWAAEPTAQTRPDIAALVRRLQDMM